MVTAHNADEVESMAVHLQINSSEHQYGRTVGTFPHVGSIRLPSIRPGYVESQLHRSASSPYSTDDCARLAVDCARTLCLRRPGLYLRAIFDSWVYPLPAAPRHPLGPSVPTVAPRDKLGRLPDCCFTRASLLRRRKDGTAFERRRTRLSHRNRAAMQPGGRQMSARS